jgi:hypothetical protein
MAVKRWGSARQCDQDVAGGRHELGIVDLKTGFPASRMKISG